MHRFSRLPSSGAYPIFISLNQGMKNPVVLSRRCDAKKNAIVPQVPLMGEFRWGGFGFVVGGPAKRILSNVTSSMGLYEFRRNGSIWEFSEIKIFYYCMSLAHDANEAAIHMFPLSLARASGRRHWAWLAKLGSLEAFASGTDGER